MVDWALEVEKRRGKRIAIIALARKLAGILYAPWRDGSLYTARYAARTPTPQVRWRRPVARALNTAYPLVMPAERAVSRKRSVVKAITYRVVIVCLDFLAIYLFTGRVDVALGFMVVSNVYTTVGYFLHERLWARIRWGTERPTTA